MRDQQGPSIEWEQGPRGHEIVFRASPIEQRSTRLPHTMDYLVEAYQLPETKERREFRASALYRDRYRFPGTQLYLGVEIESSESLDVAAVLQGTHPLIKDATAAPMPIPSKIYFLAEQVNSEDQTVYAIDQDGSISEVPLKSSVQPDDEGKIFRPGKLENPQGDFQLKLGEPVEFPMRIGKYGGMVLHSQLRVRGIWIQTPMILEEPGYRQEARIPVPDGTPISFFNPPLNEEQAKRRTTLI